MRLGISSYTYVWSMGVPGGPQPQRPLTLERLLTRALESGVGVVQVADNYRLDQLPRDELDIQLRRGWDAGVQFEVGTSGLTADKLFRWLDLAVICQSPFLRVVIDSAGCEPTPEQALSLLQERLPRFEQAGVTLAIENHDRFPAAVLREILERSGSDRVGICFDTANSIGCLESAERVLEVLGPYIVNVHIKDYALFRPPHNKGFVVEGRPAGAGDLDIPALLREIQRYGRDPNAIVELWPPPQATLEESIALEERWAEESIRYMRTLIPN